jgi:hypothetical protein
VARAPAVGVYRFWRDMGYVAGGLAAGLAADAIGYSGAITAVAAVTAASGLWAWFDMPARARPHLPGYRWQRPEPASVKPSPGTGTKRQS